MAGNTDIRILSGNRAEKAIHLLNILYWNGIFKDSTSLQSSFINLPSKVHDTASEDELQRLRDRAHASYRKNRTVSFTITEGQWVANKIHAMLDKEEHVQDVEWQEIAQIGPYTPSPAPYTGPQMHTIAVLARRLGIRQEEAEDRVHNFDDADKMIQEFNDMIKFREGKRGLS
jgi:ElaB/YqjD/DUF883 family membrane-anchored ribosome-binding protein